MDEASARWAWVWKSLFLAATYACVARLSLILAPAGTTVASVWPAYGLALAAVTLHGPRLGPGVALGAFSANVLSAVPPYAAAFMALGNVGEVLAGAWLFHRLGGSPDLDRPRDVGALLAAAFLPPVIGATVGTLALHHLGSLRWIPAIWWTWWSGDCLGALVFAPCLLVWSQAPWRRWTGSAGMETAGWASILLFLGAGLFLSSLPMSTRMPPLAYVLLGLALIPSIRLGPPGATLAAALLATLALLGTSFGLYSFRTFPEISARLLALQAFLALLGLGTLGASLFRRS